MNATFLAEIKARAPWAIEPTAFHGAVTVLQAGGDLKAARGLLSARPSTQPSRTSAGAVAILPLFGFLEHRRSLLGEFLGGTSTERFIMQFRQVRNDPNVRAIVIDVDSPGGEVMGTPELSDEIFQARGQGKKITAIANDYAASGAYWIASAADEVVVTPSGQVGSIGVFAAHVDVSKAEEKAGIKTTLISAGRYKAEASPHEPLSAEARAAIQAMVDEAYNMFVRAVARNRGVSASDVRSGFGQGRMVMAKAAVAGRMVDRIATLDEVLARLGAASVNRTQFANAEVEIAQQRLELRKRRSVSGAARHEIEIERERLKLLGI